MTEQFTVKITIKGAYRPSQVEIELSQILMEAKKQGKIDDYAIETRQEPII